MFLLCSWKNNWFILIINIIDVINEFIIVVIVKVRVNVIKNWYFWGGVWGDVCFVE